MNKKWYCIGSIIFRKFRYYETKNGRKFKNSLKVNFLILNTIKSATIPKSNRNELTLDDVKRKSDRLFNERKYKEAYEFLKSYERYGHEINWRIGRVLYNMSLDTNLDRSQKVVMLDEALQLINNSLLSTKNNSNLFKWKAIILCAKCYYVNFKERMQLMVLVKENFLEAHNLDPKDFTTLYMLGQFCYEIAGLTWLQVKVVRLVCNVCPTATDEESYYYLSKAEDIRPNPCILKHMYLLGKVTYRLKQYYFAKYYLNLTTTLPVTNAEDVEMKAFAKILAKTLERYNLKDLIGNVKDFK